MSRISHRKPSDHSISVEDFCAQDGLFPASLRNFLLGERRSVTSPATRERVFQVGQSVQFMSSKNWVEGVINAIDARCQHALVRATSGPLAGHLSIQRLIDLTHTS